MKGLRVNKLFESITAPENAWIVLAIGVGCLLIALLVLMYARWGEAKPLAKCVFLSVFAHVLLIGYLYLTQMLEEPNQFGPPAIAVTVDGDFRDQHDDVDSQQEDTPHPWDDLPTHESKPAAIDSRQPARIDDPAPLINRKPTRDVDQIAEAFEPPVDDEAFDDGALFAELDEPLMDEPIRTGRQVSDVAAAELDVADLETQIAADLDAAPKSENDLLPVGEEDSNTINTLAAFPNSAADAAEAMAADVDELVGTHGQTEDASENGPPPIKFAERASRTTEPTQTRAPTPSSLVARSEVSVDPYRQRTAPDRLQQAIRNGGSQDAEAAVQAALKWLASVQLSDGRWDASQWEAGSEQHVDRGHAGIRADTGVTGLAILAFLSAGHTHEEGVYRESVQRGLQFLLRSQAPDGNLSGEATRFAAMYCHGIATLAVSEAYAMTRDPRLRSRLTRAIHYTIQSQDADTGGWRYRPGDPGDMSQFGWQLMALVSAEHVGLRIPDVTERRMERFLRSVAFGSSGGLARYLPNERPKRSMTAEALICRFLLEENVQPNAIDEAADAIVAVPPGKGRPNYYYWYYGTLALYQLQDERWDRWNQALQKELISTQQTQGIRAGSWDTNSAYGASGGRVYTTALATLCLEVYYRYLPIVPHPPQRRQEVHQARLPR